MAGVKNYAGVSNDLDVATKKYVDDGLDGKADALHTHSSIVCPNGSHSLDLSNTGAATISGMGAVTAHDATYSLSSLGSSFNGVTITVRWPLNPSGPGDGNVVGSTGVNDPSYSGGTIFSGGDYFGEIAALSDPDSLTAIFFIAALSQLTPQIAPSVSDVAGPATVQTDVNLVTSLSSLSTDSQYPSAKCVYDAIDGIDPVTGRLAIVSVGSSASFQVADGRKVYTIDASAGFPSVDLTGVSTGAFYQCFELEVTFPTNNLSSSGLTAMNWPNWDWVDDPPDDVAMLGKTTYVACRLDCRSGVRTVTANVWRIA